MSAFRAWREKAGYDATRKGLSAAENGGEMAIVVDPVESPLWFVTIDQSLFAEAHTERRPVLALAENVIKFTNSEDADSLDDETAVDRIFGPPDSGADGLEPDSAP